MQNRTPVARAARPDLPEFAPVPRKYRHDGWTPERQKAFVEALADTGSVSRAARQVNMAQANCYALRRAPGAEEFRRAWEAALDFGVQRLKDIAFERAIEGQLVPVFVAGKLMGFRRKTNDALLMFCLRHYGQDAAGKRTTVDYFSTRAQAGAVAGDADASVGGAGAAAEASATRLTTIVSGGGGADEAARALRDDRDAAALNGFAGVKLDSQAEAAIARALEACAVRARSADDAHDAGGDAAADAAEDDPDETFVRLGEQGHPFRGELVSGASIEEFVPFGGDEVSWRMVGAEVPEAYRALLDAPEAENGGEKGDGDVAAVKPRRRA